MKHARRMLLGAVAAGLLVGCADLRSRMGMGAGTGEAPSAARVDVPDQSKARVVLNVAAAPQAPRGADWETFRAEWRSAFEAEARAAGVAFVWQDGPVKPLDQAGTLLAVQVNDWRRAVAASAAPSGGGKVDARVRYLSLADGRPFGERAVSADDGPSARQLQAIAQDVMRNLRRGP